MEPKHVFVLVVDALRADRVGAIGDVPGLTPNIDSLATEGTCFKNAFSCASNTDPSVTAILTGRYPGNTVYHHGRLVTDEEKRRVESVESLPMRLSRHGIETVAVGSGMHRWHSRGFQSYPSLESEAGSVDWKPIARLGYDLVSALSPTVAGQLRRVWSMRGADIIPDTLTPDYDPCDMLDLVTQDSTFGFIHLMDTHMPYRAFKSDFSEIHAAGDYDPRSLSQLQDAEELNDEQVSRLAEMMDICGFETVGEIEALYDAAVRRADRKIGNFITSLKTRGMWGESALFVMSDHGESLFEHGIILDHHGVYDEVIHVPLVTNVGEGHQIDELVELVDIFPTVCDLVGVPFDDVDGQSLRPLLTGEVSWSPKSCAVTEEGYVQRRRSLRTRRWKLITHVEDRVLSDEWGSSIRCGYCETTHGKPPELYDLADDPYEREDIAEDHPDLMAELAERCEPWDCTGVTMERTEAVEYSEEEQVIAKLEDLGYR
jgi:arylsulfatase A-like enzyme